jgi:hypothetical protein
MKRVAAGIGVAGVLFAAGLSLARDKETGDDADGVTTFSTTYYIRGVEIRPPRSLDGTDPKTTTAPG